MAVLLPPWKDRMKYTPNSTCCCNRMPHCGRYKSVRSSLRLLQSLRTCLKFWPKEPKWFCCFLFLWSFWKGNNLNPFSLFVGINCHPVNSFILFTSMTSNHLCYWLYIQKLTNEKRYIKYIGTCKLKHVFYFIFSTCQLLDIISRNTDI